MRGDLFLTDGTTRINLLSGIDGYYLDNWNPSIAPAKNVTSESPLSDGSHLVLSRWANATETLNFKIGRFTQNDVIHDTQDLRRLLEAAKQYFIGGSDIPVWLEARGNCETNTRYAVICDYQTSNDSNPYHKPFDLDNPVMAPWTLIVERQHWRHMPPGQSECVELSATQDYYDEKNDDFVPTESGDDAYTSSAAGGTIDLVSDAMAMGDIGGTNYNIGVRFRNVTIPNAAFIINAWVDFEADDNDVGDDCNITISADDVDSAAIFTTYADFVGRARTAATVAWNAIAHWVTATHYQTPNIAAPVQEVINRAGWASGNNLAVLLDENGSTNLAIRRPVSWDHLVNDGPVLYVWWFDATTRTFGRTATCANEVYVANKHNMAQLTHIFVDDGGVFGGNLIGSALPYALYPAVPAAGDAVYFGISTVAPDSGPFCSLVFDLSIVNDSDNIVWEYWNGAWVAIPTFQDNTDANGALTGQPFDTAGVNSVHWLQPSAWVTTAVNGVTGYWVRARIVAIGGVAQAATQQNRDVYTIVTPYVDSLASEIAGDIQALARLDVHAQAGQTTSVLATGRIFAALRSYSRGSLFTPYINMADEQNQTGVTISVNAAMPAVYANDVTSPTGRVINWTTAGAAGPAWLVRITLSTALASHYVGKYRAFLRFRMTAGTPANVYFYLTTGIFSALDLLWKSQNKVLHHTTWDAVDFGVVDFPFGLFDAGQTFGAPSLGSGFSIFANTTSAITINLYDFVLLPIDECFIETSALPDINAGSPDVISQLSFYTSTRKVIVDSQLPRRYIKTYLVDANDRTHSIWGNRANTPIIYQPNERQRWWFMFDNNRNYYPDPYPIIEEANSVQGFQVSRYLSMRGAR